MSERQGKLTITERLILTYIGYKTNRNFKFFMNNETLAKAICCKTSSTKVMVNKLVREGYKPLISKELWDLCQEQKALRAGDVGKYSQKPVVFKGMVRCGITGRTCPCEFKKGKFSYIVCWMNNKTRSYIREEYIIKQISSILNRITLPNNVIIELQKELKSSKASEKKFYAQEIKKLRAEQDKLKEKLNNLFDLRLDGELDRESFDTKRNEIQVKMNRLKNKVSAHEKADKNFDETILGLLDIATQAGYVFEKSNNLELKRLLLKFVFESLTLTEGELTYKLRFPFNEFINSKILVTQATKSYEPMQPLAEQRLQGNDNENLQIGDIKSYELAESLKNKRLAKNFASLLQIGDPTAINLELFLAPDYYQATLEIYEEIKKFEEVNLLVM